MPNIASVELYESVEHIRPRVLAFIITEVETPVIREEET